MKIKAFRSEFTNKIVLRCASTAIVATVVYVVILAFGYLIAHNITWQPSPIYYFLKTVAAYSTLLFPLAWLAMLLFIIYIYWNRTVGYIEDIAAASTALVQPDDDDIRLPEELREIEHKMNQIKKTSRKNEREAKEAEQRKNDLVVNLAHDIRTPLASVVGYLSLLDEAPDMPAEQRIKYTGITLQKAYRLEQLINEFFEITRFNLSSIVLNKGRINLSFMLQQMADEFYPLLSPEEKKAVVTAPDDLTLWGDADKLARVFNNILKNAIAYSYPGSIIEISAFRKDKNVVIQFSNSGDPIPPQMLNMIFERFFRLDASRSSQTGGAGLGLAIAKEIVSAHGGMIAAQSGENKTIFTVVLPMEDRDADKSLES
ncbi:signal transduction histidine-protein kinase BaeS [Oxobacter pfennigii]|uniref:histidine kinase n=1 Tax=Oxobacter pfennigii TaxID=36849 RepID=A0A0P8WXB5_9CLOT|nr:HAMP domain-containing sensor histidine kinase [Oxobacter pfennigii]KPU42975.1 signal transduction histidine-protein kinase BaeS [Oxobacter pfennigii]